MNGYDRKDDMRRSIEFAYQFIRARVASGGKGWREYGSLPDGQRLGQWINRLPGERDKAETRS